MNDSDFLDEPPTSSVLTDYDRKNFKLYLRLLDAEADGAAWQEVAQLLFGLDAYDDHEHAFRVHQAHLARARWMTEHGYRELLRQSMH